MNRRDFLTASSTTVMSLAAGSLALGCSRPAAVTSPAKPHQAMIALISDDRYLKHKPGPGHPERPDRYSAVFNAMDELEAEGLSFKRIEPRLATEEEIRACHTKAYVETAIRDIEAGRSVLSTGDTNVSADSLTVAKLAAGGVCKAVDEVFSDKPDACDSAFCVVRPPGHHAEANKGMGFCVFGNIAIGARYAQRVHGAERVLIVDWDVHHGNGTQDIFYDDPSVFFFSTHQSPWYPGTGAANETGLGKGEGTTLNRPLAAGSGREDVLEEAFRKGLLPALADFKPDLVMISAGFDSRIEDPLGQFVLTDRDFADLTTLMREIAHETAADRVVSVLEGGYNLDGLAAAAKAHVRALG